jgi:predicted O-linked N-acetylglucosamine transferase (SPINDLY family)
MSGSLLRATGLPELIAPDLAAYETLALRLALEPGKLASLRAKLATLRSSSPLFDTARFCRDLESAYSIMWERQQRGEPPASFKIEPQSV